MKLLDFQFRLGNILKLPHWICFAAFFSCNALAESKHSLPQFKCPYILPPAKDIPVDWVIFGEINNNKFQLREMGIIDGNAAQEKQRVLEIKERMFTEEMFEEWTKLRDRSELLAEYDRDHAENSMKCIYGRTQEESFDEKLNVILLIPLPVKKPVSCLLVRRDIDPTHEISCKVK